MPENRTKEARRAPLSPMHYFCPGRRQQKLPSQGVRPHHTTFQYFCCMARPGTFQLFVVRWAPFGRNENFLISNVLLNSADCHKDPEQYRLGSRRASRYVDVDRNDLIYTACARIAGADNAS